MEVKHRKPIKAQITYEVNKYDKNVPGEFSYYEYDDAYNDKSSDENDTFEVEFNLPEFVDEFIEALEKWTDFVPDDVTKDDFEEGFGMMQYDEEFDMDGDDMAEFARSPEEDDTGVNTSLPQKIIIYFDDGTEEDIQITNQQDTLKRVLDIIE